MCFDNNKKTQMSFYFKFFNFIPSYSVGSVSTFICCISSKTLKVSLDNPDESNPMSTFKTIIKNSSIVFVSVGYVEI